MKARQTDGNYGDDRTIRSILTGSPLRARRFPAGSPLSHPDPESFPVARGTRPASALGDLRHGPGIEEARSNAF